MAIQTFYKRVFAWFDPSLNTPFAGLPSLAGQQPKTRIPSSFDGSLGGLINSGPSFQPNSPIYLRARLFPNTALRTFLFNTYVLKQFSLHSAVALSYWVANLSAFLRSVLLKCRVPVFTFIPQRLVVHQPLILTQRTDLSC